MQPVVDRAVLQLIDDEAQGLADEGAPDPCLLSKLCLQDAIVLEVPEECLETSTRVRNLFPPYV